MCLLNSGNLDEHKTIGMNTKTRKVINYSDLPAELKQVVNRLYPNGFKNHLISIPSSDGSTKKAFTLDTGDVLYLIKVSDHYLQDADEIVTELDNFEPSDNDLLD